MAAATRVLNPYPIIEWNLNKRYLYDLSQKGVSIAPSFWFFEGHEQDLQSILSSHNEHKWFLKPIVGACASQRCAFSAMNGHRQKPSLTQRLNEGGMILQPYIRSVEKDGEFSIIYIDGRPSHTVQRSRCPEIIACKMILGPPIIPSRRHLAFRGRQRMCGPHCHSKKTLGRPNRCPGLEGQVGAEWIKD